MSSPRTYSDACGIARALDVVGERWSLMVVRELVLGPKRFTDLRNGLPHVSSDVLTQRLRELEQAGIVTKRRLPPPAASQVYQLTAAGLALEPTLIALGRWGGANAPDPPDGVGMSLDSHVMSLRTLFDPALAGDLAARLDLRVADQRFRVELADGALEVKRGTINAPDALVETDAATLLALVRGRRSLRDALRAGEIRIEGDEPLVARFLGLFPLPAPAVPPALAA